MAERYVPCTCPACKGSLVTRYTRRKHSKLYSDIKVVKKDSGKDEVKVPSCLFTQFTHAQETNIEKPSSIDTISAVHDESEICTELLSPHSPESTDTSYSVDDQKVLVLHALCINTVFILGA